MTVKKLISSTDAIDLAARLFQTSPVCRLEVNEERAFSDSAFLSLGEIKLKPAEKEALAYSRAVRFGAFEWQTPDIDDFTKELQKCTAVADLKGDTKSKAEDKVRRFVDSLGAIPTRVGLDHPIFDPHVLEAMPFRRPTTVITDTSGVLQGGLSFVARYLHPAARIKVPAVVQMEIVNLADRFFINRRATKVRAVDLLMDHTKSQAGQRVLLQLELHSDVELERTFLLGDPLRGAFEREEDKELRDLNLTRPIRSYADRLILEAARQHQTQVSHGHPVMLLTSDQGLARMAMAEGMAPLYFRSAKAKALFGRCLTGVNFHPFSGALSTVGVMEVIWELATIFGCARVMSVDGVHSLTVFAIGKDLAWAPYHSRDDLLWIDVSDELAKLPDQRKRSAHKSPSPASGDVAGPPMKPPMKRPRREAAKEVKQEERAQAVAKDIVPLYKFSVERMVALIDALETEQELTISTVMNVLVLNTASGINDYRRFLASGNAVKTSEQAWSATPALTQVAVPLRNIDIVGLKEALCAFPSYAGLARVMSAQPVGEPLVAAKFGRARSTFLALAEILELGANVYGRGFYATPRKPTDGEFAEVALAVFERLDDGSGFVATGRWLEELVVADGIHPNVARLRLQTASERNLLRRVTEGSTTETKFERHTLRVLSKRGTSPVVKVEHLYRGDFLIPGKASSSLKIEKIRS